MDLKLHESVVMCILYMNKNCIRKLSKCIHHFRWTILLYSISCHIKHLHPLFTASEKLVRRWKKIMDRLYAIFYNTNISLSSWWAGDIIWGTHERKNPSWFQDEIAKHRNCIIKKIIIETGEIFFNKSNYGENWIIYSIYAIQYNKTTLSAWN